MSSQSWILNRIRPLIWIGYCMVVFRQLYLLWQELKPMQQVFNQEAVDIDWLEARMEPLSNVTFFTLLVITSQLVSMYRREYIIIFHAIFGLGYMLWMFHLQTVLVVLSPYFLFHLVWLITRRIFCVYLLIAIFLSFIAYDYTNIPFAESLRQFTFNKAFFATVWNVLRSLSFTVDYAQYITPKPDYKQHLLTSFTFIVYAPASLSGPNIQYSEFYYAATGSHVAWNNERIRWCIQKMVSLTATYGVASAFRNIFIISRDIFEIPSLAALMSTLNVYSIAAWVVPGNYFLAIRLHYSFAYFCGILDNFCAEDRSPKCIFTYHLLPWTYRNFDVGNTMWFKRYFYQPFLDKCSDRPFLRIAGLCSVFSTAALYHGLSLSKIMYALVSILLIFADWAGRKVFRPKEKAFCTTACRHVLWRFGSAIVLVPFVHLFILFMLYPFFGTLENMINLLTRLMTLSMGELLYVYFVGFMVALVGMDCVHWRKDRYPTQYRNPQSDQHHLSNLQLPLTHTQKP